MKESTINRNRPTMSRKVALYNSLIAFYNSMSGIEMNDKQKSINEKINAFDNGNTNTDTSVNHVTIFSADVVKRLTPCHHRKARLYRLLISFMDATLAKQVENGEDADTIAATIVGIFPARYAKEIINYVDFPHLSACVTTIIEKKSEPKPKKKKYAVSVHATFGFYETVVAESEEEARKIVFDHAKESDENEWEFVDYENEGVVIDEEEVEE